MTISIDDIWPVFVCMALLLALAASPVLALADAPPQAEGHRLAALDGLRGFLALGVFFHHAVVFHDFVAIGYWHPPNVRFYASLGQGGVAMFFMVTGYLFWGRMIAEQGRPRWLELYVGRVFRIGPLYLFAVLVMLAILVSRGGWGLREPALQVGTELLKWSLLGLFGGDVDINGHVATGLILAGVTWTLRYEWFFYLSLFYTALAARQRPLQAALPAVVLAAMLALLIGVAPAPVASRTVCIALFAIGMLAAALRLARPANRPASVLFVLLTGAGLLWPGGANAWPAMLLLGAAFLLIAAGCDLFGLLSGVAARRLGNISYGIYLLQGLILTLLLAIGPLQRFALASPPRYWAFVLLAAVSLVLVATLTHVAIERPGIRLGRRLCAAIRRAAPAKNPQQA